MKCPKHGKRLGKLHRNVPSVWKCPKDGCTVLWWGRRGVTPADEATRKARGLAHEAIDPLWESKRYTRSSIYKHMAIYMGLKKKAAHIGKFSVEQCREVIEFAADVHCGVFRIPKERSTKHVYEFRNRKMRDING